MIIAGVISGTSADGINVALVRIQPVPARQSAGPYADTSARFHASCSCRVSVPCPDATHDLRDHERRIGARADLARLNFLLGELYAEAVAKTARKRRSKLDLVGCHGQTMYRQGMPEPFLGRRLAVTWQTGEGAVIAARLGVPVISDFRPADMAAGGKGAPLVPFLDFFLYRDERVGQIAGDRMAQGRIGENTRRDCESHGDSSGRIPTAGRRLQYRPGQHGDRCGHGGVVRPAL